MWKLVKAYFLSMKSDNAGEDMWFRIETANEKLKQIVLTQNTDGMQAFPVLYLENLEAVSQH